VKAAIKIELVENAAEAFDLLFGDAILVKSMEKVKTARAKTKKSAS
jgi:hypothetical protein